MNLCIAIQTIKYEGIFKKTHITFVVVGTVVVVAVVVVIVVVVAVVVVVVVVVPDLVCICSFFIVLRY